MRYTKAVGPDIETLKAQARCTPEDKQPALALKIRQLQNPHTKTKKRMRLKEALALVPDYKVRKYSAEEVEVARIRDIYVGRLARILTSPWRLQETKQEARIALNQLNLTDQEYWNMLQRYSLSSFL